MNSSASGPVPLCARGHSATYDPDSKSVFVYGGLREGQRYSELYILNTLTWKWKLVTVGLLLTCSSKILCRYSNKDLFIFSSLDFPRCRQKGTFQLWRITLHCFIRRSCLCSGESTRDIRPGRSPAVTLCTSSTQSLNSGTSPSWRATNPCLGLGQCSFQNTAAVHLLSRFFLSILIRCLYWTGTRPHCSHRGWWYLVAGRLQPTSMISMFWIWVSADFEVVMLGPGLQWYLSFFFFLLAAGRIYGVHSCEVWEHAPAASGVSPELINLETCHRWTHLV